MSKFFASVSYNTSINSRSLSAYRVTVCPTAEAPWAWRSGLVENNVVEYAGVFPTREDALRAVIETVAAPCRLALITDFDGERVVLTDIKATEGVTLARRSA